MDDFITRFFCDGGDPKVLQSLDDQILFRRCLIDFCSIVQLTALIIS